MAPSFLQRLARQPAEQCARLSHWALRSGLRPGRRDYVRFLVVAPARSGTNLLAHTLCAHPQVVCDGELFHFHPGTCEFLRPGYAAIQRDPATARLRNADAVRFLDELVFTPMPPRVRAVGFKLMYAHAREAGQAAAREALVADTAIRVIHLRRRNLLEKFVSVEEARRTDTWRRLSADADRSAREAEEPVAFDADDLRARFEEADAAVALHARTWSGHDVLDLDYENFVDDFGGTMAKVQRFLGVRIVALAARTEKLARAPLSARVANYAELKARFAATPWARFFVD